MTGVPWDEMTARWRDLYNEQAKVAQTWLESQSELASSLAGLNPAGGKDTGMTADPAALAELWKSGMALGSLGNVLPGFETTGIGSETLGKMLDPMSLSLMGGNQVGEAIRRLTEGPRLADVGSIERGMAEVMELYLEVQTAARAYESVVASAWMEANRRFTADLAQRLGNDGEVLAAKDAHKVWLTIANDTLMETHRSETFLNAQRELLRAGMDFLLAERKFVEQLVEPAGFPTRSEIDELHRTVHTLKRKVRTLEKAGEKAAAKPATSEAKPPAKTASTRSRSTAAKRTGKGAQR
jgi:polyhydroxyalkanoate synthesis regulator phasin